MSDKTAAIADLTGTYTIDPAHSRIGFHARHAMVAKVRGSFTDFAGTVTLNEADPAASHVELTIQAASITTGNEDRDNHVRSADFLDVEKFPTLSFVSTAVKKVDDDEYEVTGNLTVRDVTAPVTVEFEYQGSAKDPFGNLRAGFEGKSSLSRKDYGVTFNAPLETGGVMLGDKIGLEFDVSLIRS